MDAGRRRRRSRVGGDRFIPTKAGFDWDRDYTTIGTDCNLEGYSDYQLRIAEALNLPPTRRYFVFNSKSPTPTQRFPKPYPAAKPTKPQRQIPRTPERKMQFESPDVFDHDVILSLLDWGTTVSIALGNSVYLWDVSDGYEEEEEKRELITVDDEDGPITSVKWAPDGTCTGVHLMDSISGALLASLSDRAAVNVSMSWLNNHVLTTGSLNSQIADNDVRMRDSAVQTYEGHTKQVCSLKWSPSGQQLASGGADNLLYIWDRRKSSHWLHSFA